MSTDLSTTEQIAAAVLAEHEDWYYPTRRPDEAFCLCGTGLGERGFAGANVHSAHRAHVAQQIAARLDDGLRAGIEAVISDRASGDFTPILPKLRALLDQTRTEADR